MNIAIKVAIAAGAITLAALCVWGCFGLCQHIIVAVDRWGATAPTAGKIDAVLDHVNRPCKGSSGPDACGTLAQINKTAIDAGDAIVRTQLIERATQPHIISAMDEFGQTAKHLSSTADSLSDRARRHRDARRCDGYHRRRETYHRRRTASPRATDGQRSISPSNHGYAERHTQAASNRQVARQRGGNLR